MSDKYGFCKRSRLCKSEQIQKVFKKNKCFYSSLFMLFYHANQFNYPRLGLVIGKRKIRLATQRNRLKRIARESFRHQSYQLGYDVVLVAKQNCNHFTNQEIRACIDDLFTQLTTLY